MQTFRSWAVAGTLLGLSSMAMAASQPFSGTLSGNDPVYNRTLSGNPPAALSAVGTAVSYDLFPFYVTAAGSYTLQTLSATLSPGTADDTFLALYQTSFNPLAPLTNAVRADDDSGAGSLSMFSSVLNPGTQYYMVVTSFSNGAFGNYTGSIDNAGANSTVIFGMVPEPASALMMLSALGLGGLMARRRKAA
ncbi:MAG: PEP-CTERM sorting domain-containing protein [Burkholderiales bacterium]|nr:PEP-CTERM sorting domain-containing protein [Burkholderiales bacterium]